MKLARLIVPAALVLGLGACSSLQSVVGSVLGTSVTQSDLDSIQSAAKTGIDLFNSYRYVDAGHTVARAYCPSGTKVLANGALCAQYSVLANGQQVIQAFNNAFQTVQAEVTACTAAGQTGCSGAVADYKLLEAAAGAVEALVPVLTGAGAV